MSEINLGYEVEKVKEQAKKSSVLEVSQKELISKKLDIIYNSLIEYESKKLDVAFVKGLFSKRLEYLSNSFENKTISSNEIMSILTKDNLIEDGVVEVESGDNAGGLFYKFNINPEKAFVDGNTTLHEGDIEFLTAEATLVIKLKEFIGLQLKKNLPKDERQNFVVAQKKLDSIKLEKPKGIGTQEINNFTKGLNFNDLPEIKNGTIKKEQQDFLSEINDWFEKRSDEEKVLIVGLILTVGIVGLIYTAPLIIPVLEGVALRGFLSFISMVERSKIASFLVGISPSSGQITNNLNLSNSSRIFLNLGNISKDILKNSFPMMQKFIGENQGKKGVA